MRCGRIGITLFYTFFTFLFYILVHVSCIHVKLYILLFYSSCKDEYYFVLYFFRAMIIISFIQRLYIMNSVSTWICLKCRHLSCNCCRYSVSLDVSKYLLLYSLYPKSNFFHLYLFFKRYSVYGTVYVCVFLYIQFMADKNTFNTFNIGNYFEPLFFYYLCYCLGIIFTHVSGLDVLKSCPV